MQIPSDVEIYISTSIANVNHGNWNKDFAKGFCVGHIEHQYIGDEHLAAYLDYIEDSFERGLF